MDDLRDGRDRMFQRKLLHLDLSSLAGPVDARTTSERRGVFICYSHTDRVWLDKVVIALKSLPESSNIPIWDDSAIDSGDDWHAAIMKKLQESSAAILLISNHFLASSYIMNEEVPRILAEGKQSGMQVLPLMVSASNWDLHKWLKKVQTVNPPEHRCWRWTPPVSRPR